MVEYGYINEDGYLRSKILEEFTHKVQNGDEIEDEVVTIEMQAAELAANGWKPVRLVDESRLNPSSDFSSVHIRPVDKGDYIDYEYEEAFNPNLVRAEIDALKKELSDSDYMVTKCYEATLTTRSLPYDIDSLHEQRQRKRDRINELELLL